MNNDVIAGRYMPAVVEALKAFPINPLRTELVMLSENVTFRVTNGDDGAFYVLRLHRPGYHTLAGLNSERIWTGALAEAGIATQAPVLTHDARYFHQVDIPNTSEQRYAGMTEWVEGTVISDYLGEDASLEERERCFHQIGALAATIHNQSSSWTPPEGFERPSYDSDGLLGEAPQWGSLLGASRFGSGRHRGSATHPQPDPGGAKSLPGHERQLWHDPCRSRSRQCSCPGWPCDAHRFR
jgi:Ser/Thr protein kinase RdoA (MazF antagonist)